MKTAFQVKNRLVLQSSLLLAIFITVVLVCFDKLDTLFYIPYSVYIFLVLLCGIFIFAISFVVLKWLFRTYTSKEVAQIAADLPYDLLPSQEPQNLSMRDLGLHFSELNQKASTELGLMREMEIYRREYLGNVSHELKTPLFSIQGYTETLLDGAMENPAILEKYLLRVNKSVDRLINIVQDLDKISQYETGEIRLEKTFFDINALVLDVLDLLDLEAKNKDASLQHHFASGSLLVYADRQKISQVLTNLVANAIHYANREQAVIRVSTRLDSKGVRVEVQDNGMGIKPDVLPRIFERFYRVNTARNRKDGGSGLGLSIVKHILEAHGTSISVESEYLQGTLFWFNLTGQKESKVMN